MDCRFRSKRVDWPNWPPPPCALRTRQAPLWVCRIRANRTERKATNSCQAHLIVWPSAFYDRFGTRQISGISWRVFMAVETKSVSRTSPREVLERAKAEGVEVVDVRFVDLPGTWQHFSLPLGELEVDSFKDGLGFDGSSIRGFQSIDESDMLLIPDPDSATIDPVLSHKTLFLICDVVDPITRQPYSRDARFIAKKAEEHLRRTGIADVSYWGPEAEFYLFNSLRFDQNAHSGYYYIDSEEGIWNSGKNSEPNLAFRPRHKEGYFPVPPTDKLQDLRSEHDLVPPARSRLRGADQPRLLEAQSLGVRSHPDVLDQPEDQARRISLSGPGGQPVPRVLGLPDGRPRRDQAQDPSARARGQRHLRARGRGEGEDQVGARLTCRIARRVGERPRVLARGRSLHQGRGRDVDRLQAEEGSRRGRAPTAPVGVHALQRRLDRTTPRASARAGALSFLDFDHLGAAVGADRPTGARGDCRVPGHVASAGSDPAFRRDSYLHLGQALQPEHRSGILCRDRAQQPSVRVLEHRL